MTIQEKAVTYKTYDFDDLELDVQEKVLDKFRIYAGEDFSFSAEFVIEDVKEVGKLLGIDITNIYYSGFCSQGDGACFDSDFGYVKGCKKAVMDYAPQDKALHEIVQNLVDIQGHSWFSLEGGTAHSGHYYHSGCMAINVGYSGYSEMYPSDDSVDDMKQVLRDFADWIYSRLEFEYEFITSEDVVRDNIRDNEYRFLDTGEID